MTIESYPLCWPSGYPRTSFPRRSRFGGGAQFTLYRVRTDLEREIRLLGGRDLIISTDMRTRKDGGVYSNAAEPADSGVAVYFTLKGTQRVLACDRWRTVRENTHAISLSVAAMRGLDRWGVSEILERIFTGFTALPEPTTEWWQVLGVEPAADLRDIKAAYRELIKQAHPDAGGSSDFAVRLNDAYHQALRERGGGNGT